MHPDPNPKLSSYRSRSAKSLRSIRINNTDLNTLKFYFIPRMVKVLVFVPPDRLSEATAIIVGHLDTYAEVIIYLTKFYFTIKLTTQFYLLNIIIKIIIFQHFAQLDPQAPRNIAKFLAYLNRFAFPLQQI
jgi:hypothetical protein